MCACPDRVGNGRDAVVHYDGLLAGLGLSHKTGRSYSPAVLLTQLCIVTQGDRPSWALAAVRGQRRSVLDHGPSSGHQEPAFSHDAHIQEDLEPWQEHGITEVSSRR